MEAYYENSRGQKIDLITGPYLLQTGDFFDYEWNYDSISNSSGSYISRFYNDVKRFSVTLSVAACTREEFYRAIDSLYDVTNHDIVNKENGAVGRLYVGSRYLKCWVIQSKKVDWEYGIDLLDTELVVVCENPTWIKEKRLDITDDTGEISDSYVLDYPHAYPHDYPASQSAHYIINKSDASVNFVMEIYGYCSHPIITIGNHLYEWVGTIYEGEYLVIDSREGLITRYLIDGTPINGFNLRSVDHNIFELIPPGIHRISMNSQFRVVITALEERGEPSWSS